MVFLGWPATLWARKVKIMLSKRVNCHPCVGAQLPDPAAGNASASAANLTAVRPGRAPPGRGCFLIALASIATARVSQILKSQERLASGQAVGCAVVTLARSGGVALIAPLTDPVEVPRQAFTPGSDRMISALRVPCAIIPPDG